MNARTMLIAGCAATLTMSGCRNSQKGAYAGKRDTMATTTTPAGETPWGLVREGEGPWNTYPQITVDYALRKYVAFAAPVVEKGETMRVTVPVRLLADQSEQSRVQYRFIFLTDKGIPLRDQPDWRYELLDARQQKFLSMSSTDTAADWRMEVRTTR